MIIPEFEIFDYTLLLVLTATINAFKCPQDIAPCTCHANTKSIACVGPKVTQDVLNSVFSKTRTVNEVHRNQWLEMNRFDVHQTTIATLTVTPFVGTNFNVFDISNNAYLSTISDGSESPNVWKIGAENVLGNNCDLTTSSINEFGKIFGQTVKFLSLRNNRITSFSYLDRLRNLVTLDLANNYITIISSKSVQFNNKIELINLSANQIASIGAEAFSLVRPTAESLAKELTINLTFNRLDNQYVNRAFSYIHRPTKLILTNNNFVTISEYTFQNFLLANTLNTLDLANNPFRCSSSMCWLRIAAALFEQRVTGIVCQNYDAVPFFKWTSLDCG